MPFVEGRILVCLCPLVNVDLFKKGHYHLSCKISEKTPLVDVSPVGIKDYFGGERSGLTDYCFPGACMVDDGFLTQTVFIEYTSQSYIFAEYFMFKVCFPLKDYNDVYIPCQVSLTLDLMFSSAEEMPTDYKKFEKVSSRTVLLTIDWRKGLHDHCPVLFDYFHLAGVGVTIHSSLYSLSPKPYKHSSSVLADKTLQANKSSSWLLQQSSQASPDQQLTYAQLLFGEPVSAIGLENKYSIPTKFIDRAKHVHEMLSSVLLQARDSLRTGFVQMTGVINVGVALSAGLSDDISTIIDMEGECRIHLEALSTQLQAMWEWFCHSVVIHPNMTMHLASSSHSKRLEILLKTFITPSSNLIRALFDYTNTQSVEDVAMAARKLLSTQPQMNCVENIESSSTASVILVEQCAWEVHNAVALEPMSIQRFQTQLQPYLANKFPSRPRMSRHTSVHLVVCVHGLQGNQFDLRLYRSFIELALPHYKLEFLMSEANQFDTFVDFVRQTDRLEKEVLTKIAAMVSPPNKISFLAHSLGGIVVRSLVTRPSMINFLSKLHLFLSICGPHLGTQHQNGMISAGMWLVRKWYSSRSLLQLSLKDAPSPRDSFLYQLSEAHTFDCFKHVVLLTSLQDKYVPHKSARVYTGDDEDDSLLGKLSEEMANNILTSMEQAGVNLVRVTVHHALPLTTDSVIGRAAHVAMLDNEHLIEKIVMCHLVQYFLDS